MLLTNQKASQDAWTERVQTPVMIPTVAIREAGIGDIEMVAMLRIRMAEENQSPLSPALSEAIRRWLRENTERGIMRSWLAYDGTDVVGTVSVRIRISSPREHDLIGQEAYVHNLFVEPAYRSKGVGRALMQTLMDWCATNGYVRIALRTSPMGRSLYEKLGFLTDSAQMAYRGEN
jgi:GNAT superfamily N-acetyltransferase